MTYIYIYITDTAGAGVIKTLYINTYINIHLYCVFLDQVNGIKFLICKYIYKQKNKLKLAPTH